MKDSMMRIIALSLSLSLSLSLFLFFTFFQKKVLLLFGTKKAEKKILTTVFIRRQLQDKQLLPNVSIDLICFVLFCFVFFCQSQSSEFAQKTKLSIQTNNFCCCRSVCHHLIIIPYSGIMFLPPLKLINLKVNKHIPYALFHNGTNCDNTIVRLFFLHIKTEN